MSLKLVVIILIASSTDGFILLMKKGATSRVQGITSRNKYPLLFTACAFIAITVGYVVYIFANNPEVEKTDMFIVENLLTLLGAYFIWMGTKPSDDQEHVDDSLTMFKMLRLAILTNIDTVFVGLALAFAKVNYIVAAALGAGMNYLTSFAGMELGYKKGFVGKWLPILGGVFMIIIGLYLEYTFIVR